MLLPKAYIRYRLTGELIEEMSDASGTLWLDVGARDWSDDALAATGLSRAADAAPGRGQCGRRHAGRRAGGALAMARRPVLAGGAGDNAAGAIGLSAIRPGDAFVSLGTSGVLFAVTERFRPWPRAAVHAFCHAMPDTWHQMGVTLSAAASLAWWAAITGRTEAELLAELGEPSADGTALFLPYLGGERTPHNDPSVRGAFACLSHAADRPALTQAVLEGVAFSLRDCLDALTASGTRIAEADVIGGGSRSRAWIAIIASALGIPLHRLADGETGTAFGAARLARMAVTGEAPEAVCTPPARAETILADPALADAYAGRHRPLSGPVCAGRPMMKLQGKIAVVTGAARGIGRAICERYVAEGAFVFVTDVDEAKAAAVASALGAHAAALRLDVAEPDLDRRDDRRRWSRSRGGSTSWSTTPEYSIWRRSWRSRGRATGRCSR